MSCRGEMLRLFTGGRVVASLLLVMPFFGAVDTLPPGDAVMAPAGGGSSGHRRDESNLLCGVVSFTDGSGVSLVQLSKGRLGHVGGIQGPHLQNSSLLPAPLPKVLHSAMQDAPGAVPPGPIPSAVTVAPRTDAVDGWVWPMVVLRDMWRYMSFIAMQFRHDARCFLPIFVVLFTLISAIVLVFVAYTHLSEADGDDTMDGTTKKSLFLCKELIVPDGCECIFAMPSLRGPEALGTFSISDKTGRPLLSTTVEGGEGNSERVTLAGSDGRSFAFCRVNLPDGQGGHPTAYIYRPGGELFARLGQATHSAGGTWRQFLGSDLGARKADSGAGVHSSPRFALWSSVLGDWQFHFHGAIAQRRLNVTDQRLQLVATAEPGDFGFDRTGEEYYLLHLAAQSDAGLLLCCILALDRLTVHWPSLTQADAAEVALAFPDVTRQRDYNRL